MEKKKIKNFFEDEAELGSDDEENDDVRKHIDRLNDDEENEEGLDDDLDGFVDHNNYDEGGSD